MTLEERHQSEIDSFVRVSYKSMVCIDCKYVYTKPQEVTICEKYPGIKPSEVLIGGECPKYVKEEG